MGAFFYAGKREEKENEDEKNFSGSDGRVLCMALIGRGEIPGIGTKRQKKTEDQKKEEREWKKIWDES